jgi:hypothetical protein
MDARAHRRQIGLQRPPQEQEQLLVLSKLRRPVAKQVLDVATNTQPLAGQTLSVERDPQDVSSY